MPIVKALAQPNKLAAPTRGQPLVKLSVLGVFGLPELDSARSEYQSVGLLWTCLCFFFLNLCLAGVPPPVFAPRMMEGWRVLFG